MANREDILAQQTYKGQCDDDAHRVFYTLRDRKDFQPHRNSKLLALLIQHLLKRELISQEELDEILFECID